jgi:hypothetical protein
MGNVDSIGNVIFLAGAERYACPLSTFMFHGVGFDVPGGLRMEEPFLRERLDTIEADHKRIVSLFRKSQHQGRGRGVFACLLRSRCDGRAGSRISPNALATFGRAHLAAAERKAARYHEE